MSVPHILISRRDLGRLDALLGSAVHDRIGKVADFLSREISRAEVVDDADVPPTLVTMGSVIRFCDDATGRETVARLAFPGDPPSEFGNVSVLTPVGAALLGLSAGQSLSYETWDGSQKTLTVREIVSGKVLA